MSGTGKVLRHRNQDKQICGDWRMNWFSVIATSTILFLVATELELFALTIRIFGIIVYNTVAPGNMRQIIPYLILKKS